MDGLSNIFARNCTVRRIEKPLADAFLLANHRLGTCKSRYRYGMFVQRSTGTAEACLPAGTLVAVSTFSTARHMLKQGRDVRSSEWIRYASLPGIRVVGGMGKMLDAFVADVHPDDVMTYADPSACDGGSAYKTLGFTLTGEVRGSSFRSLKFVKDF